MQPYRPFDPSSSSFMPAHTPQSPSYEKETHIGNDATARLQREAADEVVREYEQNQARLAKGIESARYLLGDLRNMNGAEWPLRYPHLRTTDGHDQALPHRPGMARRTLTFADDPANSTDVVLNSVPSRRTLKRSLTLAPDAGATTDNAETSTQASNNSDNFSILGLTDLNLGTNRHSRGLITQLDKSSISALFDNRFAGSLEHLTHLLKRIHDSHSRVLVTGDLNAGKSTLINALLRRHEVMPTDQQPLTTRFVEVVSAKENQGREEIHVLDEAIAYNPLDNSTFSTEHIDHLEQIATDPESDANAAPLRVFLREVSNAANPSILHNGVVDISLIDAPGLNRDSIKTTANFARQDEIDVVVFVVSAANHFTLSAKDFIWQAGREKAHLFIVVNRFDQIRDKERCRRTVLDQIKQLSPETYADAADLVHFVDSAKVALGCVDEEDADELDQAFSHLEHSLRSFVLVNRAKSKLGPARNYVTHLLADVELLASANALEAARQREASRLALDRVKPVLDQLKRGKEGLEENLVAEEETSTEKAVMRTRENISVALERVGRGQLAFHAPGLELPVWNGYLGAWDYAKETRRIMLASLDYAATLAEQDARGITTEGVARILQLGEKHLPSDVERSNRVFNPSAMFSVRPTSRHVRRSSGIGSVGLGLVHRPQLAEVTISDLFDIQHHLFLARARLPIQTESSSKELIPLGAEVGGLGLASLAVGAYTMSGNLLSMRHVIDGALRVTDVISHPMTRKWIGPVIGLATAGAVVYVLYELPRTIPQNVGRHLQSTLGQSSGVADDDSVVDTIPWTEAQAQRIGKEVRKVMRLASWDLREQYRTAVDQKQEKVRESEESEKKSLKALSYFGGMQKQIDEIREEIGVKV